MPRGSIVSGWQYLPLPPNKRAMRDVYVRMLIRAARALAEQQLVKCTDFAFEQEAIIRTPTQHPGVYREQEAHTMAPDEAWFEAHPEGTYTLEFKVRVNQPERGEPVPVVVAQAMEAVVGAGLEEAEEAVQGAREAQRRVRVRRADLARVFAAFRRPVAASA